MADRPSPEQCPQPFWHSTHRYCPMCTWTEPLPPLEEQLAAHDQDHIVQFFKFSHLPPHLAGVSEGFAELALVVLNTAPQPRAHRRALRKLLEAKDAAVRAVVAG